MAQMKTNADRKAIVFKDRVRLMISLPHHYD